MFAARSTPAMRFQLSARFAARRTMTRSMTYLLVSIFVVISIAEVAHGNVFLQSGPTTIELTSSMNYYTKYLTYADYGVVNTPGSGQGTAIFMNGNWAGSIHGNETLISATLKVDGVGQHFIDEKTYCGNVIEFTRTTNIGGAYQMTHRVTLNNDVIDEQVTLRGLDASRLVSTVYGLMSSRNDNMIDYAAYAADKSILTSGKTSRDDNAMIGLSAAAAVAQYDPTAQIGTLTTILSDSSFTPYFFIWDRPEDNKLYAEFKGAEGYANPGNSFFFHERVKLFSASPDTWMTTAILPIAGDADGNGLVDQDDYKIWYDNYGVGTTWAQANFKGAGVTDQADYKTWYDNYGAGNTGGVTPEPATMALLVLGGVVALHRRTVM
jgi:hypothetical protein